MSGSAPYVLIDAPAALRARLGQGHPWVYRSQLDPELSLPPGSWVQVRCGSLAVYGVWDAEGAIAVRVFSRSCVPDEEWVARRVTEAWESRAPLRTGATTAYRWVYGESDGLPGIVVDLYAEYAVIQLHSPCVAPIVPWVADALHSHVRLRGILARTPGSAPTLAWGRWPPRDLVVEEGGLLLGADLAAGQKTGLYFDHRDNRVTLAPLCAGQTVLDCFCYAGGFSLHAARAGAAAITLCDGSGEALAAARHNFALNGLELSGHRFVEHDCFRLLERYAAEGRHFGVVILDPPSFARDRSSRHAAERAYVRLNRYALQCVEPGGVLASASCTSQVSPEAFREALAEAARQAGRRLLVVHDAGQPLDHPVPAHFPEARYLKFVVGRVLPVV